MSAFSDTLETSLLNHLLRGPANAYTALVTVHLGLFTADPGENGDDNEVSGGSYARVAIDNIPANFPQCATSGVPTKTNGATFTFPTATAAWGTITHWALFNSAAGGTDVQLVRGTLNESRYVAIGDPPKIAAGEMTITLANATGGGLTDFAKRKLLDLFLGAVAYTTPTTVYAAAGTALVGEAFTEWSDAGYSRQAVTFGAPSAGIVANDGVPGTPGAAVILNTSVVSLPGPLTALGIFDDASVGNALLLGPMGTTRSVATGNAAKLAIGSITATLN